MQAGKNNIRLMQIWKCQSGVANFVMEFQISSQV